MHNQTFYFKHLFVLIFIGCCVAAFAELYAKQETNAFHFMSMKSFFDKKDVPSFTDSIQHLEATNITATQASLSWSKSENAEKYTVILYKNGLKVKNVSTAFNTIELTGLEPGTIYTWNVVGAISKSKSAIASFTTKTDADVEIEIEPIRSVVIIGDDPIGGGGGGCTKRYWVIDADNDDYFNGDIYYQCSPPTSAYVEQGTKVEGDCDDTDPAVNIPTTWVLDADEDGYYIGNEVMACSSPGSGYVVKSTQLQGDCNDNINAINPGAIEIRDGIDNNCDGNTDEGLPPIDLPASPTNLTSNTPGVTDYTIPTGITFINFTVQGAKGGSLQKVSFNPLPGGGDLDDNPDGTAGTGGLGARIRARFTVDAICEQGLKPGGIIRLIVGSTPMKVVAPGPSSAFDDPINYGQGGGGGSSILYKAPGSTEWIPLIVAGGGGGAAAVVAFGDAVTPSNGQPGITLNSNVNTGVNDLGGRSTYSIEKGDVLKGEEGTVVIIAGGGGGMSGDGKTLILVNGIGTEIGDCGGGKGLDADADGGVSSDCTGGNAGGAGFGAGGSGNTGGGGGGGYSGGNAGAVAMGGFGAGSYINNMAEELPVQSPLNITNGIIIITTGTTASTVRYYPDGDHDGFGTGEGEIFCTNPGDNYATKGGDCDDEDPNITTAQTWVLDFDEDNYYIGDPVNSCTSPGSGYKIKVNQIPGDCNDNNNALNPGAIEIDCDGIDNNCDGDEGGSCNECIAETYYRDEDGDGFGNPNDFIEVCNITPNGYVPNNLDCNDDDIAINPTTIWYKDADNDGYSDGIIITQCEQPDDYKLASDLIATSGDCDDEDAEITIANTWYLDFDGDGYAASTIISCTSPGENYTTNVLPLGDCDDNNPEINPTTMWYEDRDNDGYPSNRSITGCERPQFFYGGFIPTGFTLGKLASELDGLTLDCDDTDASVSPGTIWYKDADNDFFSDGSTQTGCYRPFGYKRASELTSTGGDCNDSNPAIKPSATEICDGIDNNCNGLVDEGFIDTESDGIANCIDPDDDNDGIPDQADCATLDPTKWRTGSFYIDADEDGLGFGGAVILCYGTNIPLGYVANNNDCDDADRFNTPLQLNCPAAIEINDCSVAALATVTGLAYNTTGAQITEQQLINANGSIIKGACAVASIAYKDMVDPASTSLKKIIKRSFTATDIKGRVFECIQTITVEDKTVPLVLVNDITVELGADGKVTITTEQINNNSSDACGIADYSLSQTEFDCSNLGQNKIFLTVTDINNNEMSAEATVTIEDKINPTFTAPADRNITLSDNCSYTVPDLITGLTGSDNCGTVTFTQSPAANTTATGVHNGWYDVIITANDGNGNSIKKTVKLIVTDETDPVLTMPLSLSISCSESVSPANTGEATATDNCDAEPLVTNSDISTQGTNAANCNYYNYTITRTWKALDAAGNSTTLDQIIEVADITKPEITCVVQPEGGFKRSTDAGLCSYKVQGTEFDAIATDNCATPVITWSVSGATNISGNNSMANAELNFGLNTITWTAKDPCGNVASCEIIVDVNKIITTTNVTVTPDVIHYSDKVTFTATVTPYDCLGAENIGGKVTFKIGSLIMGEANVVNGVATLNDVPVLEDMLYDANLNDPLNATAGPLNPGSKTVTALFSGTDADYQVNNPTTSLNINCEDAEVSYTGQQYFTVNPNSNTGTVVLSASVTDFNDVPAGARGDIRNATVTFKDGGSSGPVIGIPDIPMGLIDPGNTTEGIASTEINYTLTNSDISNGGKIFEVWTGANNYYCGETGGELTNVTIALPGQEFVTGGGQIIMQNSKGKYAGYTGKKMNFGLVMKWNKSGKNLQGKVNIIYRAEVNGVRKIYQIKSNAISSLAVLDVNDNGVAAKGNDITFRKAIIVTKANLTDVTNPLVPISLGGGYNFEVTAWESTTNTTGALDRISVQLMGSGSEGLLFSSNWSGGRTVWQTLNGGKIQVRSNTTTLPAPITNKRIEVLTESSLFDLKGYPNPSSSTFNIHVQSSDVKERIFLRVIDISGRTVQKIENIKAGQILNIGATYRPGIYVVEIIQGNNRKQLKLIKQPD